MSIGHAAPAARARTTAGLSGVVLFDPTTSSTTPASPSFRPSGRWHSSSARTDASAGRTPPRGRARRGEVDPRPRRALPRVPGRPTRGRRARADALRHGLTGSIGADQDGYPWILGYRGPTLSELSGASVVRVVAEIEAQIAIKSEAEIALIRESIRWSNLAHRLLSATRGSARGDRGLTARKRRGHVRHARRDRRDLQRRRASSRAAPAPATEARSDVTPRFRTHWPGTSCSPRVTSSSPARALPCGATSRSSSARCSSASRPPRKSGCSRICSSSRISRSLRSGLTGRAPRSTSSSGRIRGA